MATQTITMANWSQKLKSISMVVKLSFWLLEEAAVFQSGAATRYLQFVALTHIMVFTGCLALVVFEGSACTSAAGFRYVA
ncbi:MAG: hypothetical protein ACLUNV_06695 [Sutterella wadsworthensis]